MNSLHSELKMSTYIYLKNKNQDNLFTLFIYYFPNEVPHASSAKIYAWTLSLLVSYLLGREVFLWGHAWAGGGGHRGTATAPFKQQSHCLQPPHPGQELQFQKV